MGHPLPGVAQTIFSGMLHVTGRRSGVTLPLPPFILFSRYVLV